MIKKLRNQPYAPKGASSQMGEKRKKIISEPEKSPEKHGFLLMLI
jgi:hypothetical protein